MNRLNEMKYRMFRLIRELSDNPENIDVNKIHELNNELCECEKCGGPTTEITTQKFTALDCLECGHRMLFEAGK